MDNVELLNAVNAADFAMMKVVDLLIESNDPRWREMAKLQTLFCAPLQTEIENLQQYRF